MDLINHHFDVDYLVVGVFLLITLVVGIRAGRGVSNVRDYAVGRRTFGTAALVLTFLATEVGGQGVINIAGEIGTTGIIVLLTFLSFPLSYLVQALWIAPKMVHFPRCMTMGDIMHEFYGLPGQVTTGVFSFVITICCAGAEIVMLGVATQSLLGVDAYLGMVVGGLLLTVYVVHGGMQSVAATDVLQFLVLLVLLPVLAATALQHAGGIKEVLTHIPAAQRSLSNHPKFSYYLILFLSFGVFHFNTIDPALIQRMLMAQSGQQLRRLFLTLAGLFTTLFLIFLLLGTTGHQLYPDLAAAEIVPHMIRALLPVGLRGLMVAGILAVVMASADSYLHAAGLTLVHDVLHPVCASRAIKLDEMRWVRYATLFAGLLIIGLGLTHSEELYNLIFMYLEFAVPLLVFPFFSGVLGLKPDRLAFYISSGVTLSIFLLGKLLLPEEHAQFLSILCVLSSGLAFFTIHFVRNKGFVVLRRGTKNTGEYLWQPRIQYLIAYLGHRIPTPQRIIEYSQKRVDQYGAPYILFGAFCCINFTLPYFMWEHASRDAYNLMLHLRVWGGLACGLLIVRDKWPSSLLRYLPTFWHLTLLYCLPFTSTVMFLLTQGSAEWLINVAITIMFLIVLVDWLSFLILSVLGVGLGFLFHRIVIGPISLHLEFSTGYLLVYTCVFSTVIALLFSGRKEQHLAAKLREISDHYYGTNQVISTEASPATMRIATMIDYQVQETIARYSLPMHASSDVQQENLLYTTTDCLHYFFPTALAVIQQGDRMIEQLAEEIKTNYIFPQEALLSLRSCVRAILKAYERHHPKNIRIDLSEDYRVDISFNHLLYSIIHVLRFLHAHHQGDEVRLWTTRHQGIHMRLLGQALSPALLQDLFTLFPVKEKARNLGLAISKLLVEAQGGRLLYATSAIPRDSYTEFIIALPPAEEKPPTGVEVV